MKPHWRMCSYCTPTWPRTLELLEWSVWEAVAARLSGDRTGNMRYPTSALPTVWFFLNRRHVSRHLFPQKRPQQPHPVVPIPADIVNLVQQINEHNGWQRWRSDTDVIIVASVIGR